MSNQKNKDSQSRPKHVANKRPQLTHFLCFPLVNQTSATQLADSLADFKSRIPLVSPSTAVAAEAAGHAVRVPLVPDDALRPLGTLHLTLGVMSLPTKERLKEALDFLQSIDLQGLLREAEIGAASESTSAALQQPNDTVPPSGPINITLSSLHALPTTRSATILHASPVDPTSRLYPFSVKIRNKFMEAGFMHCEMIKDPKSKRKSQKETRQPQSDFDGQAPAEGDGHSDGGIDLPKSESPESKALSQAGLVPRPLLLHATIANTIYAKGRRIFSAKGKKRKENLKFDATELIAMFGDSCREQGMEQPTLPSKAIPRSMVAENRDVGGIGKQSQNQQQATREPFVWARDIRLDRLCICEMGAKAVIHNELNGGPVLGQEYTVVGRRWL